MGDDFDGFNDTKRKWRNDKLHSFEKNILPKLLKKYNVIKGFNHCYIIDTKYKYYPKANSLYFIENKNWIKKYALNWIKKYLI